ncbi:hypothetical protein [Candidatus Phycosocius spiralis]|uniref:Lipoprotein n=1 Tax=Candidatus Phycosocius spiralis TaxID=2815099 RepID=A0ABQ4PY03_9PROT|nr:hypothetical protein [Candidatus Phycosocius spiralis]GIU67855.1 hypothetical protein PsB1_2009 [Candidatus Phycosocius spiralis]
MGKNSCFLLIAFGSMLLGCEPSAATKPASVEAVVQEVIDPGSFSKVYDYLKKIAEMPASKAAFKSIGFVDGDPVRIMNILEDDAIRFTYGKDVVTLYSGCRPHECITKGALGIDSNDQVVIFAVQAYISCEEKYAYSPCSRSRSSFLFIGVQPMPPILENALISAVSKKCMESTEQPCIIYVHRSN